MGELIQIPIRSLNLLKLASLRTERGGHS